MQTEKDFKAPVAESRKVRINSHSLFFFHGTASYRSRWSWTARQLHPASANTCHKNCQTNTWLNWELHVYLAPSITELRKKQWIKQNILLVTWTLTCMTSRWRYPRKHMRSLFFFILNRRLRFLPCQRIAVLALPRKRWHTLAHCTLCLQPNS